MKLYAAFSEYGDIWPTTIRTSLEDCQKALLQAAHGESLDELESHGVGIGSWDSGVQGWFGHHWLEVTAARQHEWGCDVGTAKQ